MFKDQLLSAMATLGPDQSIPSTLNDEMAAVIKNGTRTQKRDYLWDLYLWSRKRRPRGPTQAVDQAFIKLLIPRKAKQTVEWVQQKIDFHVNFHKEMAGKIKIEHPKANELFLKFCEESPETLADLIAWKAGDARRCIGNEDFVIKAMVMLELLRAADTPHWAALKQNANIIDTIQELDLSMTEPSGYKNRIMRTIRHEIKHGLDMSP